MSTPFTVSLPTVPRWFEFYSDRVRLEGDPNDSGWINFPCVLPTHGKVDDAKHGGVNVYTGRYKCWADHCRRDTNYALGKPDVSETLSPEDFLVLTLNISSAEAADVISNYKSERTEVEFKPYDGEKKSDSAPMGEEWEAKLVEVQNALRPDLDIVIDYMRSRGLDYETLKNAGIGYEEATDSLVFPYTMNGRLICTRSRLIDGGHSGIKSKPTIPFRLDSYSDASAGTIVIVEGETDTLRLEQVFKKNDINIPVIGIPGTMWDRAWNRHVEGFQRIILLPQGDSPAENLIRHVRSSLGDRVEVAHIPWKTKEPGKDIADFLLHDPVNGPTRLVQALGVLNYNAHRKRVLTLDEAIEMGNSEPDWIVPGLFEKGTITLIVGEPKTFKTWLGLELVESVSLCKPFLGVRSWTPTEAKRCMFVEEEGSPYRLGQRLSKLFGEERGEVFILHRQSVQLDVDESFQMLADDVLEYEPELIVLDPYASLHSQDENTVQGTMLVMRRIHQLQNLIRNLTIAVIHHTPKGGATARGSGALWGSADLQLIVRRLDQQRDSIKIEVHGRDLSDLPDLTFTWDEETGRHVPTGKIELSPKVYQSPRAEKIVSRMSTIFNALRQSETKLTIKDLVDSLHISDQSLRADLDRLVSQKKAVKEIVRDGRSTKVFYAAVDDIELDYDDNVTS